MNEPTVRFALPARILHWLLAVLLIAMLFIGAGMVSTVSAAHDALIAIHKPLGIAILVLVVIRIGVRLTHRPPPLPADLPAWQAHAATLSHWLLYALMLAMPLVGWAMLSAGGYPVQVTSWLRLPAIAPHALGLFTWLRDAHGFLAYLLFLTFLAHLAAAMYHALVRRDGVLRSMTLGRGRRTRPRA